MAKFRASASKRLGILVATTSSSGDFDIKHFETETHVGDTPTCSIRPVSQTFSRNSSRKDWAVSWCLEIGKVKEYFESTRNESDFTSARENSAEQRQLLQKIMRFGCSNLNYIPSIGIPVYDILSLVTTSEAT